MGFAPCSAWDARPGATHPDILTECHPCGHCSSCNLWCWALQGGGQSWCKSWHRSLLLHCSFEIPHPVQVAAVGILLSCALRCPHYVLSVHRGCCTPQCMGWLEAVGVLHAPLQKGLCLSILSEPPWTSPCYKTEPCLLCTSSAAPVYPIMPTAPWGTAFPLPKDCSTGAGMCKHCQVSSDSN